MSWKPREQSVSRKRKSSAVSSATDGSSWMRTETRTMTLTMQMSLKSVTGRALEEGQGLKGQGRLTGVGSGEIARRENGDSECV